MDVETLIQKIVNHPHLGKKLLAQWQTDIFENGQRSGKALERKIRMYNSKRRVDEGKRIRDIQEDVLYEMVRHIKESIPCPAKCRTKLSVLGYLDRLRDTLFERMDNKVKMIQEGYEQSKLFED